MQAALLKLLLGLVGLVVGSPVPGQERLIELASDHCIDNGCSSRFDGLGACVDTSHELNLLSLSTQFDTSVTSIKGICSSSVAGKEDCCHCMKRLGNSSQTTPSEPSGPSPTRPTPTGPTRPEEPTTVPEGSTRPTPSGQPTRPEETTTVPEGLTRPTPSSQPTWPEETITVPEGSTRPTPSG